MSELTKEAILEELKSVDLESLSEFLETFQNKKSKTKKYKVKKTKIQNLDNKIKSTFSYFDVQNNTAQLAEFGVRYRRAKRTGN